MTCTICQQAIANLRIEVEHKDQVIANLVYAMRRASGTSGDEAKRILLEELDGPDAHVAAPRQEVLL